MRIIFFETMPGEEAYFRGSKAIPQDAEVEFVAEPLTAENLSAAEGADAVSVFVKSMVDKAVIDALPSLKLITTRSTGYDHVDWRYAKEKGIRAANVPTYGSHTVAEFTFALLLTLSRKVYQAHDRLREEGEYSTAGLEGFDLYGKTLGVVGTGRIGRNVIAIAKGFGMEVIAFDAYPDAELARSLKFAYHPLNAVLAKADIVTLHVPYNPDTHHLIGSEAFSHFKKGSILINTARGEVVDTAALKAALDDGTLAGAAMDVLEGERDLRDEWDRGGHASKHADMKLLAANHELIGRDNVIVTPHIAFETTEAMHEIMRVTAETIGNWARGADQKYLE